MNVAGVRQEGRVMGFGKSFQKAEVLADRGKNISESLGKSRVPVSYTHLSPRDRTRSRMPSSA